VLEFLAREIRQGKEIKEIGKAMLKRTLRLYQKKLLDLTNTFAGYKTNIQKLVAFIYTNNKQTEKEVRKTS
jgi:hypothetical protein